MIDFPLYAFTTSNTRRIIVTRGSTPTNALNHARSARLFRGREVYQLNYVPIDANLFYQRNHPFDWLNTMPIYERKGRYET